MKTSPNIVSTSELYQYLVECENGEKIGYLDEFYVDEFTWNLIAFRVDASQGFHWHHFVISNTWIDRIDLSSRRIFLNTNQPDEIDKAREAAEHKIQDAHALKEFRGLEIQSTEKTFGRIQSFLFYPQNWHVENLVIKTHQHFHRKLVLLKTSQVKKISWDDSLLITSLHWEEVLHLPEFEKSNPFYQTTHLAG